MLQRMSALEKKLGAQHVARASKGRLRSAIQKKSAQRKGSGKNFTATDGISSSRVYTNTSSLEDHFSRRREKIADISGSTSAFLLQQQLYINPGNSVLFPIFSQIAAVYEEYRVHHLRFTLETEAYTASGTAQSAGIACMATNFDPDDSVFSNLTQMENYYGSVKGPPYATKMVHDVIASHRGRKGGNRQSGDLSLNNYFVYSSGNSAAPSNSTSKFYDIGLFLLAVANMVGTGIIGELYVEYEFTMIRPKQQTPLGQNLLYAHVVEGPAVTAAASGSAFLGTTGGILRAGSTLPTVSTKNTFTLPVAGVFLVNYSWGGSVAATATFTPGSNISAGPSILDDSQVTTVYVVGGGAVTGFALFTVSASGTGAANTLTVSVLTSLAAGNCDLIITQLPNGVLAPHPRSSSFLSSSSGDYATAAKWSPEKMDRMFAKLVELGVIEEDDQSPVTVTREDGVVMVSQPDYDRPLGTSMSAPPPSVVSSRLSGLGKK